MTHTETRDATSSILYGRRRGRPLRAGRKELFERRLPELRFALPPEGALDPRRLFAAPRRAIFLELGFGGGEHLAAHAEAYPDAGLIGAEVYENGVAKLVAEIERRALGNVRIFMDDGRRLAASLAERSLDRAFILFPDPWPKERHKKRRIVTLQLLDDLARALVDGGELRLATDDHDYAREMRERVDAHPAFRPRAPSGPWPETRYEQKAIARGRSPVRLCYERDSR